VKLFLFAALCVCAALGQATPAGRGAQAFNATLSFNENYDGSSGASSELDGDVGWNFANKFNLHTGAPYYLWQQVEQTSGSATVTRRVSSIGDMYLALAYDTKSDLLHYTSSLVGTAPTGDSSLGFSTGRFTGGWTNRLSHDFGAIEPFGQVGVGTGSEALGGSLHGQRGRSQQLPFSTLGMQSAWRAGAGVPLRSKVDLEGAFYAVLPFGNQKIYSREVSGSQGSPSSSAGSSKKGQHGRTWELARVAAGNSDIAADHGVAVDLDFNPLPHVEFDWSAGRSLRYQVNTMSFTVSYHFASGSQGQHN
jgi:hypothetical protein